MAPAFARSANRQRRRWFRVAAVALPLLGLFAGAELILRGIGYGHPIGFLIQPDKPEPLWTDNPFFLWRFMPPGLARWPAPIQARTPKPPGTFRVLVLGESAAMGDPEPAFGFSRVLQVLLEARLPGQTVEVINTGIPAINSPIIREIAADCRRLEADVWVLYAGNNEVLGPGGLTSAFGNRPPHPLVRRLHLAVQRLRVGQGLASLLARLSPPPAASARLLSENLRKEPVPHEDPRLARVRQGFADNLRAIVRTGERAGARVLINTLASNLRDCAPFLPGPPPVLPDGKTAVWQESFEAGRRAWNDADSARALAHLQVAAELRDEHADLQYLLGRASLEMGRTNEARGHLERARDLDGFRARPDTPLNALIRRIAAEFGPATAQLVDAESAFAAASPDGIPGHELLCDHVHFNFAGNYQLARLQAEAMTAWLPALGESRHAGWLSRDDCALRLGWIEWSQLRSAVALRRRLSSPLYRAQLNHAERDARLRREVAAGASTNTSAVRARNGRELREAAARWPHDWVLFDLLGKFLLSTGDRGGAATAWRTVIERVPHGFPGHYQLGLLLNQSGQSEAALPHLENARRWRPLVPEVHIGLGTAWSHLGEPARAVEFFQQALKLDPNSEPARVAWAQALRERGDSTGARAQLEHAVDANPNSVTARFYLALLLQELGDQDTASGHWREVLRLDPGNETARRQLGQPARDQPTEARVPADSWP
ncbi:MAG: tetratricopeptide repeat protein [Verrucomicrobiales bacterium]|nr:tetratricopeptide repeat protein [Verrucomicrobiales bacterium]